MDLTHSWREHVPAAVAGRYEVAEVRNAAGIMAVTNPDEFADVVDVLGGFELRTEDVVTPGGNTSPVARRLDETFRRLGWREGRHDTKIVSSVRIQPWLGGGETEPIVKETEVFNEGYKVDNVKGRLAVDVEWNAKDGNLDRDIGAYRALYDAGIIDAAVIITRSQDDLVALATELGVAAKFNTTTTTNLVKLLPRLTRGDAGGCPVLAVAITARCYRARERGSGTGGSVGSGGSDPVGSP